VAENRQRKYWRDELARSAGAAAGILTLLLDAAKGAAPVLAWRQALFSRSLRRCRVLAGLGALTGHCFPCWLKFRLRKRRCDGRRECSWFSVHRLRAGALIIFRAGGGILALRFARFGLRRGRHALLIYFLLGAAIFCAADFGDGRFPRGGALLIVYKHDAKPSNDLSKAPSQNFSFGKRSLNGSKTPNESHRDPRAAGWLGATALAILLSRTRESHQISIWVHDPTLAAAMREKRENGKYLPGQMIPVDVFGIFHDLREALRRRGNHRRARCLPNNTLREIYRRSNSLFRGTA